MNLFSLFFVFHIISFSTSLGDNGDANRCPAVCVCIWRGGKITAECVGANLMVIPTGASKSLQVLNLSRNNFQTLPSKVFQERGLTNLQKIYLSECKLGRISSDAFFQLNGLVELDLSDNFLTFVPSESLGSITRLRRLNLHKNPIRTIKKDSFSELTNLIHLDLSDCEIETVEKGAFNALKALDHIKLDGNRLSTLPDDVFNELPLANIGLHRNPWKCDCQVRPILEYLNKFKITPSVPPACASPSKLNGLMWNSLELSAYACPPVFKVYETQMRATVASNVSFVCVVKANPSAKIYWTTNEIGESNSTVMINENDKFNIIEEMVVPDLVSSTLLIHHVETADTRRQYICNAENQAESVSQNFTLTLINSEFTTFNSWSKIEVITGIVISFLALIVILVICITFRIRSKKDPSTPSNTSVNMNNDNSGIMRNGKLEMHNQTMDSVVMHTPDFTKDLNKNLDYTLSPVIDYLPKANHQYDGSNGSVIMVAEPPTQLYYNYENYDIFQQPRIISEADEGYFENNIVPFISHETLL